jgi:hypothetical protein
MPYRLWPYGAKERLGVSREATFRLLFDCQGRSKEATADNTASLRGEKQSHLVKVIGCKSALVTRYLIYYIL